MRELEEIRTDIDAVDSKIRELFGKRMQLADEIAVYKAARGDSIFKPDREKSVIDRQCAGLPAEQADAYGALLKRTMELSRKHQYSRMLQLRDCFPFVYTDQPVGCEKEFKVKGTADRERLYDMLLQSHMYIFETETTGEDEDRYDLVRCSRQLCVLPGHNRAVIRFVIPGNIGAMAGVLTMIGDYGVNLRHFRHRICQENAAGADGIRVTAELETNIGSACGRALLYQLFCETQDLQILGSYRSFS